MKTTAKKTWTAGCPLKQGQLFKYERIVAGITKQYVLKAKYTDTIPEMWPAWFENMYPNTWYLSSVNIDTEQIWPGDTFIDFNTGVRYTNNTLVPVYKSELQPINTVSLLPHKAIIDKDATYSIKLYPLRNILYNETKDRVSYRNNVGGSAEINILNIDSEFNVLFENVEISDAVFAGTTTRHQIVLNLFQYEGYTKTVSGLTITDSTANQVRWSLPADLGVYNLIVAKSGSHLNISLNAN